MSWYCWLCAFNLCCLHVLQYLASASRYPECLNKERNIPYLELSSLRRFVRYRFPRCRLNLTCRGYKVEHWEDPSPWLSISRETSTCDPKAVRNGTTVSGRMPIRGESLRLRLCHSSMMAMAVTVEDRACHKPNQENSSG